jgi:molybdopterin biosynthesis enzyme
MPESPYPMISVEDALEIIRREIKPLSTITIPFAQALDMILA